MEFGYLVGAEQQPHAINLRHGSRSHGKLFRLTYSIEKTRLGLLVVGSSIRYRKRIRVFEKIETHSRAVCADYRFLYLEQGMWVSGTCAGHVLYRSAVIDANGIVPIGKVLAELGPDITLPGISNWVAAWIAADDLRPWPPSR